MATLVNEWDNVVSELRNNIVFSERHKDYGAYQIRKEYGRTLWIALFSTIGSVLLISYAPDIIALFKPAEEIEKVVAFDPSQLEAPPPVDPTEPPPPPPPPPPPVQATVKFTPPVVDDEVKEVDPPPIQQTETTVAEATNEGTGGDEIVISDEGTGVVESAPEEIFTVVEQMPEFPGGPEEMYKFINKNIQYPQVEKENSIDGKVFLQFTVDKEGKISDIRVLRGVKAGPGLEKEAMRVVKLMPPWKPGKQNGRAVPVYFNLPVTFKLK